jgi:hypothetical protein
MNGKIQTGCSLGVLEKFEESGASITRFNAEDEVYKQVNRVCMYRRPSWDYSGNIYDEVFIKSTIVILHDDGDLVATLKSIYELDTPKPPDVIICHTSTDFTGVYKIGSDILGKERVSCVYMADLPYDGVSYDECFKRCKNGWIFFIPSGQILSKDTLKILNFSVNERMHNHIGTTGIECYMAVAYKLFRGQKGMIRHALSEIPNATIDWSVISEDYRLHAIE